MSFNQNIIDELIKYKRGEFIPNPDEIIDPKIIFGYISYSYREEN